MPELQPFGSDRGGFVSPGGFEFGLQGFNWAAPIVRGVTFFLDGSALVADQYGRPIRGLVLDSGEVVLFAPSAPEANNEGEVRPRPQYATHEQVVAALSRDLHIDIVAEINGSAEPCPQCKGRTVVAERRCMKCGGTGKRQTIVCAGWPQLPAEQLKRLKVMPATPEKDLQRIPDGELRRAALVARLNSGQTRIKESAVQDD